MRRLALLAMTLAGSGCATAWPHGERVVSREGDTIVIEMMRDPQREPPAFKIAVAYCASRGDDVAFRSGRLNAFGLLVNTYACVPRAGGR